MLRPYQVAAKEAIRAHYRRGERKVLLHAPTGSGKTTVFCDVLKGVHDSGKRGIMIVRGRKLVDQAHKRLFRERVPHGVMMAGHWLDRPGERIQICSVDTLTARGESVWPQANLVVIDEAHMALSPGFVALAEHYDKQGAFFLPVTATPYVTKSLRHIANVAVQTVTVQNLIDDGFLVDAEYYIPGAPDLSGVRSRGGDYVEGDLEAVMSEKKLVGDCAQQWLKLAEGRPSLYFCVTVKHSKQVAATFQAMGISAVHCDAETPEKERNRYIAELESGKIKIICNVGIFCTGVDIPSVSCIGMMRPTESYPLYIQQAGRGTRPAPGKNNFLLIDHAGNVRKHGKITENPEYSLDGKIKKFLPLQSVQVCENCFAGYYGRICPHCGEEKEFAERDLEPVVVDGELVKFESESPEQFTYRTLERTRKMRGYKRGWVFHKMKEQYGEEAAKRFCPQSAFFWAGKQA